MPVAGFLPLENSGLCQVFLPGDERLALSRAGKQSVTPVLCAHTTGQKSRGSLRALRLGAETESRGASDDFCGKDWGEVLGRTRDEEAAEPAGLRPRRDDPGATGGFVEQPGRNRNLVLGNGVATSPRAS